MSEEKDIPFSFCIITDNSDEAAQRIDQIIDSIRLLRIPEYEVIVIGGTGNKITKTGDNIKKIDFDESIKTAWLTKKKNEVVKHCRYENVVMFHDYFTFHFSWYLYYKKFFNKYDYDICCNPIMMADERRDFTDWVTWDHPTIGQHIALPYSDWSNTKNQYISGGYFLVKKKFLEENPFNEDYAAGDAEDVEWSLRVRDKAKIICNPYSYCKHLKEHRNMRVSVWLRLL